MQIKRFLEKKYLMFTILGITSNTYVHGIHDGLLESTYDSDQEKTNWIIGTKTVAATTSVAFLLGVAAFIASQVSDNNFKNINTYPLGATATFGYTVFCNGGAFTADENVSYDQSSTADFFSGCQGSQTGMIIFFAVSCLLTIVSFTEKCFKSKLIKLILNIFQLFSIFFLIFVLIANLIWITSDSTLTLSGTDFGQIELGPDNDNNRLSITSQAYQYITYQINTAMSWMVGNGCPWNIRGYFRDVLNNISYPDMLNPGNFTNIHPVEGNNTGCYGPEIDRDTLSTTNVTFNTVSVSDTGKIINDLETLLALPLVQVIATLLSILFHIFTVVINCAKYTAASLMKS